MPYATGIVQSVRKNKDGTVDVMLSHVRSNGVPEFMVPAKTRLSDAVAYIDARMSRSAKR